MGEGHTFDEQMRFAYTCIQSTLNGFHATLDDVVQETIFTTDFAALRRATPIWSSFYEKGSHASTWVGVTELYDRGAKIEVDVVVALDR